MSKKLHYWSRCALVATLAVLVTFNPAWAGRGLRCWLKKRSECRPVCCEPIQICHVEPSCGCSACETESACETIVLPVEPGCCPGTDSVPECCGSEALDVVHTEDNSGQSHVPTPAHEETQPKAHSNAVDQPSAEAKPEPTPDNSPSDTAETSSAQQIVPPAQPEPDIAEPEPLPPAEVVAVPEEPAVEADAPVEPSAADIFGEAKTEAPSTPPADDLFDSPAVPEQPSDDLFDAPSTTQPEPAPALEDDLFSSPAAPADQSEAVAQPEGEMPQDDLFDAPAAPSEQPEADLFDQPAEPAVPAEPANDLFDTPAAPTESSSDDDLFGTTTDQDAPVASTDDASSGDLFAEPAADSAAQPSAVTATDDDLFGPVDADQRKSDDDLFGSPAPSTSQPAPEMPSAEGDDDLFGTPASQPENKVTPVPAEEDDLFGKRQKDQPSVESDATMVSHNAYRQWRDNTGNFEIEAKLAEIHADYVRLLKTNGNYCKVPMRRLSDADRQFVQQVASRVADGSVKMVSIVELSGK